MIAEKRQSKARKASPRDNDDVVINRSRNRSRSRSGDRSRAGSAVRNHIQRQFHGQHNIMLQRQDTFQRRKTRCEVCDKNTSTIRRIQPNEITWFWCAVTTLTSFCLVPFFIDNCNNKEYYCSECLQQKEMIKGHFCCCNCC